MNCFFLFLVLSSFLLGEVIPTRTLDVLDNQAVDGDTWVVFDVDMTLVVPKESILWGGASASFHAMAKQVVPDHENTLYRQIILRDAEWELIEHTSPSIVRSLQEKGATVLALTALEFELADWRVAQLEKFGFDFSAGPKTEFFCYKRGILFSGEKTKGEVLVSFLNHLEQRPKRVIFIDDQLRYISSVESELEKAGIPITCYHYQEIDHRPISYVPVAVRKKMETLFTEGRWSNLLEVFDEVIEQDDPFSTRKIAE